MPSSSLASSSHSAAWAAIQGYIGAPTAPAVVGAFQAAWAMWTARTRRRRDALAIDRRTLADIGLQRGQVIYEAAKPFWRP